MSENLLQFIWLHRLYATQIPLKTLDGETVLVIHPGRLNRDSGPDFLEAKLNIGNTLWAGNIELHLKSSDWNKHGHEKDITYSKLIMHVVYEFDQPIETYLNTSFPTLELKSHIDQKLLVNYEKLMRMGQFIACENVLKEVRPLVIHQQLSRMLAERLEEKTHHIFDLLKRYNQNWQEVFYVVLARGFGLHINQDAFEQLALQTPLSVIAKHRHHVLKIEALLFGQAGFLFDYFDEEYPLLLQKEYHYLQSLHQLQPIEKFRWKFLRLRPANFPTIRIAEFARLISTSSNLFSKVLEASSLKDLEKLFHAEVADYWLSHYNFHERGTERNKSVGKTFIHTLLMNAIIPTMYMYGKLQGDEMYCEKAIRLIEEMPPEDNNIIRKWKEVGVSVESASDTQALLQLKKKYCDPKRCLDCSIGFSILKQ